MFGRNTGKPLKGPTMAHILYKVHNLPALHTELGVAAEYILEGDYFGCG